MFQSRGLRKVFHPHTFKHSHAHYALTTFPDVFALQQLYLQKVAYEKDLE